jgi:hypothetical protein
MFAIISSKMRKLGCKCVRFEHLGIYASVYATDMLKMSWHVFNRIFGNNAKLEGV